MDLTQPGVADFFFMLSIIANDQWKLQCIIINYIFLLFSSVIISLNVSLLSLSLYIFLLVFILHMVASSHLILCSLRRARRAEHPQAEPSCFQQAEPEVGSKSVWLRSWPAASAEYTRYLSGLEDLRPFAFGTPLLFGRNAGRIGRAAHRTCHGC